MPLFENIGYGREKDSVILDIGTAYTKCGFSGENGPRCIIPSEVRRPKTGQITRICDVTSGELHGTLVDFLHVVYFRHLLVTPAERRVVVSESVLTPSAFRETLAKVLFNHYQAPSVAFCPSHLLSLFTLGNSSALIMDAGYTETLVLPVYEGVPILKAWQALPLAGKAIHSNLENVLLESATVSMEEQENKPLSSIGGSLLGEKILEDIKVRCCFVTNLKRAKQLQDAKLQIYGLQQQSPETETISPPPSVDYPLDGGKILHIDGKIREAACELLFEQDNEEKSVATLILDSILQCPIDIRKTLAENILLTGGTTMLPGFKHRLMSELHDLLEKTQYKQELALKELKFYQAPAKENYASWLGGSILGALEILPSRSVSKEVYQQSGVIPDWSTLTGYEDEETQASTSKSR